MTPEQYQCVKAVFMDACECEPAHRDAFVESACKGDEELRAEVARLLARDAHGGDIPDKYSVRVQLDNLLDTVAGQAPLPTLIGRYRIVRKIGQGGMGVVYEAEQDHPHRRVAVKILSGGVPHAQLVQRFRREVDFLGRLHHPGIASVYEAGVAEVRTDSGVSVEQPFFAMELVDGEPLDEYARRHDLNRRARLELLANTCDAVQHAHEHGVIHRDLKPANILVEPGGQPKVLDFGVARATDSDIQITTMHTDVGKLIGTLPYMSPEQIVGDVHLLDTRSDIYALGVCLYELLAGRLPFDVRQKPIPEAARIIREEEPTRLGSINAAFYGDIETIVCKALEKDRERRYESAAEFAADIRRHLAHEPITAHPPSTFYQIRKFAKRNRGLVTGLGLAVLVLIAGVITSLTFAVRAGRGEQRASLSETASRRASYRAHLAAAEAMADTYPTQALQQLEAAPPEYRGWEWHHLATRVNTPIITHSGDPASRHAATVARQPDGRLITALMRGGAIELLDLQTGDVLAVFRDEGELSNPLLAPRGSHLAALSATRERLITWDVATRAHLFELPAGVIDLPFTQFSPDGSLLAVQSYGGPLTLRETTTGSVAARIDPPPRCRIQVSDVAFDTEGKRVAFESRDSSDHFALTVCLTDGEVLASESFADGCTSVAFSPDGMLLAVGQEQRSILILDAATLGVRGTLYGHGDWVTSLAFSPDGKYLASSSRDDTTRIWDHARSAEVRVLMGGASSLAFSADNALLAAGSSTGARVGLATRRALRTTRPRAARLPRCIQSRPQGTGTHRFECVGRHGASVGCAHGRAARSALGADALVGDEVHTGWLAAPRACSI